MNLAHAVKVALTQLRAEGERLDDIASMVNKASQFVRPDFDSAFESVTRRFGPLYLRLVQTVATCDEGTVSEGWTVDPMHFEEHPVWIAASKEDKEAHRAMEGLECAALSLSVLNDSLRPRVNADDDIPF